MIRAVKKVSICGLLFWLLWDFAGDRGIRTKQNPPSPEDALLRLQVREESPWRSDEHLDITLPGVVSAAKEPVLCTAMKIPQNLTFITGFSPLVSHGHVHHFLVYQCEGPSIDVTGNEHPAWQCESPLHTDPRLPFLKKKCRELSQSMMFGWDVRPKSLFLPEGVAYAVGRATPSRYIVVNAHFTHPLVKRDYTGVRLHLSRQRPRFRAGMISMLHTAPIPPLSTYYNDYACLIRQPGRFYPFAYYGHTHHLGKMISTYKVEPDSRWKLIGKQQPMRRETTFPPEERMVLQQNDLLAVRCTMVNPHSKTTTFDSSSHHEMCLLLLYYATADDDDADADDAYRRHLPSRLGCVFTNESVAAAAQIGYFPEDASQIQGVHYLKTHPSIVPKSDLRLIQSNALAAPRLKTNKM